MDSPTSDASPDKVDMGPSFRKFSSDAANRTYRRPTHVSQSDSSSSEENNEHESSRNAISQKDSAKEVVNGRMRKDDEREIDWRRLHNRANKDYDRYSDRYSHREPRRHNDRDHRRRDGRHGDERGRDYARSSRSERSDNLDHKDRSKDREKEHERYAHRRKDVDSGRDHYYKDRDNREYYDDRRGPRRGPELYGKNEKGKEKSRNKETDEKEVDRVERRKQVESENGKRKHPEPASSFGHEEKERETKFRKPADTNNMEEKAGSSSKQETQAPKDGPDPSLPSSKFGSQAVVSNDVNAAKAAAMKAAEFVNRNIGGGGVGGPLTAEQKKKLLWGNKKNESTGAETVQKWDNQFTDRERQEKFNKLMGLKGNVASENKPEESRPAKSREEFEMDLEKQYTAGLRRRDGRTVGLGL